MAANLYNILKSGVFILAFTQIFPVFALAQTAKSTADDNLTDMQKVQRDLVDPKRRKDMIKDPKAKDADANVQKLGGTEANQQMIYELAAQVFGNMKDKSPDEMMKILEQAQRDPAAFAESWSPEQREKLKRLGQSIEATKKSNP
jgi:hypothetical protein